MPTPQSVLLEPARRLLAAEAPRPVALAELYGEVERAVELDEDDFAPPTLRGLPTSEPSWHRNLRNALQQEKREGRLANVAVGLWTTPRPDPRRHVDPETAWAEIVNSAQARHGDLFESPARGQRYRVSKVESKRVTVERVDGSKPSTLTPGEVRNSVVALNTAGGRTGARTLNYTVAKETAIVFLHPSLGWEGDEILATPHADAGRPATATEALDRLTRREVLSAMDALDRGAETAFADSTAYDVVHEGRRYAPLRVVAVAAEPLLGQPLVPHSADAADAVVKGGLGSPCFRALERCGFEIVSKRDSPADDRSTRYWALAADPRTYRIEDAVRDQSGPDLWTTRGRDLRPGDRVVVWRTTGGGGPRGVVALGEVVGPARPLSDEDNLFWVVPDASVQERVPVRYVVPPGLPLYLGHDGDEPARALSVARARGGTVFNVTEAEWDALVRAVGGYDDALRDAEEDAEEADVMVSSRSPTEKDQIVRARRGQGTFRRRVEAVESGCRLTGTTDRSLLIASHIKPWRVGTDRERLDGHNGLLMAPHVDRLFDGGLISFADDGTVLVREPAVRDEMVRWGLDPDANVGPFSERQRGYLAYHRTSVFQLRDSKTTVPHK